MLGTLELVAQSDWRTILPGALCIPDVEEGRLCLNPLADAPEIEYVLIEAKVRPLYPPARSCLPISCSRSSTARCDWDDL